MHATISITLTCLEMMSSALTLFHLKTCSSSTNLFQVLGVLVESGDGQFTLPKSKGGFELARVQARLQEIVVP